MNSKNETAFLASIADDAVLDELMLPHPFAGRQNVKTWFETWTGAIPDANSVIATILGIGDFVLVETIERGTLKGPFGRLSASNKEFTVHRGAIVQLKDGKLTRISGFMNGQELATAVGQWPPTPGK